MSDGGGGSLLQKAWQAALVVVVTALAARVAYEVMKPLLPLAIVTVTVLGIYGFMVKG